MIEYVKCDTDISAVDSLYAASNMDELNEVWNNLPVGVKSSYKVRHAYRDCKELLECVARWKERIKE